MKCQVPTCNSEEIIYSGVDAFVLGVPTEQICYSCANIYNQVIGVKEKYDSRATSN
jgi:hypothetical protein